jgi:hypothetical protein
MTRDELIDRIETLENEQNELEMRLEAMTTRIDNVLNLVIGEDREVTEDSIEARPSIIETLDQVADDVGEAKRTAKDAEASVAEVEDRVKVSSSVQDRVRVSIRDRLVKNALLGNHDAEYVGLKLAEVDEKTPVDLDVAWTQAKRAASALATNWDAFVIDTDQEGDQVVRVIIPAISADLANRCESSLDRDDLANIVVARRKGGSA